MALTQEQFIELDKQGFTPEEIASFEQRRNEAPKDLKESKPSIISQLTRLLMKNSILEQTKTSLAFGEEMAKGNIETPKQGESLSEYSQKTSKVLEPREKEIIKGGTLKQLEDPITAALAVSFSAAPWDTAKLVGKYAILDGLDKILGVSDSIKENKSETVKDLVDITGSIAKGSIAGKSWLNYKPIASAKSKVAGNIIDSLIKPQHKEYMFGKDPGGQVAREGIWSFTMEGLQKKISDRTSKLDTLKKEMINTAENSNKTVDLTGVIQPLIDTYSKLRDQGAKNHASELLSLKNAISDFKNNPIVISRQSLKNITPKEAYGLRDAVSSWQNWTTESPGEAQVNGAISKTYRNIVDRINKTIPELTNLNEREANLISAKTAIKRRVEKLRSTEPTPVEFTHLLNLPMQPMRTVLLKTLLAKNLATTKKRSGYDYAVENTLANLKNLLEKR